MKIYLELEAKTYWRLCALVSAQVEEALADVDKYDALNEERDDDLYQEDVTKARKRLSALLPIMNALEGEK